MQFMYIFRDPEKCTRVGTQNCVILHRNARILINDKTLQINDLQRFVIFELWFKWFHQKMSFISKWLYIFTLKNCFKRNLPPLLHLISAPFCSVSQSRVPTLVQRYCFILKYKQIH